MTQPTVPAIPTIGIIPRAVAAGLLASAMTAACGGAPSPPPASPSSGLGLANENSAAPGDAASQPGAPMVAAAAPNVSQPAAPDTRGGGMGISGHPADYDDPTESATSVTLATLVSKSAPKGTFPKKTTEDKECWRGMGLTGNHAKDYEALSSRCGTPTGLVEYVKPVEGRLHSLHDKRDTYSIKLLGGYCYRYFAVADESIKDLDILVTKPNGALVADDKTSQPVAIIESDDAWCMPQDATYEFHIEVDGTGTGKYVFAVWARPKG